MTLPSLRGRSQAPRNFAVERTDSTMKWDAAAVNGAAMGVLKPEVVKEVSKARILEGVHDRHSAEVGKRMGAQVGALVAAAFGLRQTFRGHTCPCGYRTLRAAKATIRPKRIMAIRLATNL